jgi:hypothetical protein
MLLSFALALMILAGFPQYVYILAFAVLGRLVHFIVADRGGRAGRAAVAAWASAALALAGALAAPQLLPTAEFVGQSQRAAVGNFEFVTSFSMPPSSLLTLVAPQSLGDCRKAPTDSSIFIGVIGVSLGALGALRSGPLRGLWLGQAILGIVLAMGKYTPVFRLFYIAVPGVSLFRVPSRFLLLFLLAAAPLAARGAQRILRGDDSLRRHLGCLAAASAAVLVGIVASVAWSGGSAWAERGLPGTALALLFLIAGLWGLRSGRFPGAAGAVALGLLLVVEMAGFNGAYFSSTPKDDLEWPEPFVRMVKSHPDYPFRIATVTGEQTPVIGMCELAGIDHVGGYDPMMLRRYTELCNAARGKPVTDLIVAMVLARPGPVFDMLGARYWIVPGPRQEPPGWKTIGEFRSAYLYENPRALPRAFLVGRSIVVPSPEKRLQVMAAPAFDARRIVVLETEDGALPSGPEHVEGAVQLAGMAPGRYELRVDCATDALLVLAESYYPGWTAEIDGSPAPLLRANHLLQAVRIPPGRHELRFTYQSRYLRLGFALAVAGLVVPLAAAFLWKRRGSGLGTSRSRDESGGRQQSAVK